MAPRAHQNGASLEYSCVALARSDALCLRCELCNAQLENGDVAKRHRKKRKQKKACGFARDIVTDHEFRISSSEVGKMLSGGWERKSFVSKLMAHEPAQVN